MPPTYLWYTRPPAVTHFDNIKSTVRVSADDSVLYREINFEEDYIILSEDVERICKWAELWQMKLNVTKCPYYLTISNKINY